MLLNRQACACARRACDLALGNLQSVLQKGCGNDRYIPVRHLPCVVLREQLLTLQRCNSNDKQNHRQETLQPNVRKYLNVVIVGMDH